MAEDGMLIQADARQIPLQDSSVHCAVTSPPYWGLRDYHVDGQLGLERKWDYLELAKKRTYGSQVKLFT